jgi:hypothetical protein
MAAEALRPSPSLIATYPLPVQAFLRPDLVAASLTVSASGR